MPDNIEEMITDALKKKLISFEKVRLSEFKPTLSQWLLYIYHSRN